MAFFTRAGIKICFKESGAGLPFVFQHGLGADLLQPVALFPPPAGVRLLAFDCRAHGRTPMGPVKDLGLATFADDLIGLLDATRVNRAIIGGISMGAAVALSCALRYPERVLGLVLSRPAWLDGPNPWNVKMFSLITRLIQEHGAKEGRERFERSDEYQRTLGRWPEVAHSLAAQFNQPDLKRTAIKFERIIKDAPCWDRSLWRSIRVPTLVLGNRRDPVHPFEYAEALAQGIVGAQLRELTPKSVSVARHEADARRAIKTFLLSLARDGKSEQSGRRTRPSPHAGRGADSSGSSKRELQNQKNQKTKL